MDNPTTIIYVNQAANGTKTGSSWVDAYTDLQDALAKARAGDQIWVAQGVYKPTLGTDRTQSFVLVEGVAIYGGFFGDELKLTDRDWKINKTILSGDLGTTDDGSNSSHHVVRGKGLTSAALLDGFTITGGSADGDGPVTPFGIYLGPFEDENVSLNDSRYKGGGLFCDGSGIGNTCNPTLRNLCFTGNYAFHGGAICNDGSNGGMSSPSLVNIFFAGNNAGEGGAIYNFSRGGESSPTLTNVVFLGNNANYGGGALYNRCTAAGICSPTLTNVTFSGNRANKYGMICNDSTEVIGNITSEVGNCKPTLTNVILWGNEAVDGSHAITNIQSTLAGATPTLSYTIVEGVAKVTDIVGVQDGGNNLTSDPRFVKLPIDAAPSTVGDLRLRYGSPAIGKGNPAALRGADTDLDGKPRIRNNSVNIGAYEGCVIFVNQAATGAKTGNSWVDAYTDLQEALKNATAGDEIWVAKGTYKPTSASDDDARKQSFELKDLVEIYGGFAGTETGREARDWHINKTILSGNIGPNDEMKDNSYHVVTGNSISKKTILDGFTIAEGYANGAGNLSSGGGLYLSAGSPTLQNLIICGNQARLDGGGLYNDGASPTLINVVVSGNRAHAGGALYNNGKKGVSSPTLINVTISGNRADSRGGGMYNNGENGASNPTLTNVMMWGNSAGIQRDKDYDSHEVYNYPDPEHASVTIAYSNPGHASVTIAYSLIQGGIARIKAAKDAGKNPALAAGEYPRFGQPVHPAKAPTTEGDLRLQAGSPASKSGAIDVLPRGLACDLGGRPRVVKGTVDIGAYQSYTIVYVNQAADSATKDGSSWATAYTDLQQALEQARAGDEIWVAKGVYKPTTESSEEARTKSFTLVEGVELYGGFDGTETRRDQRDWRANSTTLSGAIGAADNNKDNSYHVVYCEELTRATVLDGFTISDGNANGAGLNSGGGLYCYGSGRGTQCSPTLRNLTFSGNYAEYGGALYNNGTMGGVSSPTLINVVFSRNTSGQAGGAMYNGGSSGTSSPTLTNVLFADNTSKKSDGGAIYNDGTEKGNCSPTLTSVVFSGNKAAVEGGAIYNDGSKEGNCSPTLTNVIFNNNSATGDNNNTPMWNDNASPTIIPSPVKHSTITYVNRAASGGKQDGSSWVDAYTDLQAALKNAEAGAEIWVVAGEYKATTESGDAARTKSFALVEGVELYGGFIGTETNRDQRDWRANKTMLSGAGTSYHVATADRLTSATILDGFMIAGGNANGEGNNSSGGGLYCRDSSLTLRNLVFSGNYAKQGGGLFCDGAGGTSSPRLTDVIFSGNNAETGGGLYCNGAGGTSSPRLTSVILWNNSATTGHAMYSTNASPTIACSTIQDGISGRGMYVDDTSSIIDLGCNRTEDPFFIKLVDPVTAPTTAGDLRPQHVVRTLATPFFSVPHTKDYDWGTKPFTVMAVVSPDTIVPIPLPTPLSTTNTGKIHTGNIMAQYGPYQQDAVGWELSLIADPKGQDKGNYLSFVLYGKQGARQEYLARLSNEVLFKLSSTSGEVLKISDDVFNRSTHVIAVVRAETGACQLYLNGFLLDTVKKPSNPDTIDVTNKEPLTIGKLLADAPEDQQGGIVRKVCLWKKALTQDEVMNRMHGMMSSTFNVRTELDYKLEYTKPPIENPDYQPPPGESTDYHVRLHGVRKLEAFEKQVSQPFDETRALPAPSSDVAVSDSSVKDAGSVHQSLWDDVRRTTGQALATLGSATYETQSEDPPFGFVESFTAERDIWLPPECVGFWTFHGIPKENNGTDLPKPSDDLPQAHNGKDLSTTSNDLPQDQCIPTEDQSDPTNKLQTVLPFYIQRQQQTQWCWASSSVSVANFYVPQSPQTQVELVTDRARDLSWSLYQPDFARPLTGAQTYADGNNLCNYPYYITVALSGTGTFADWVESAEVKELIEKLRDVRPIVARIQWSGGGGHFVVVFGTYNTKTELMVVINDPWSGMFTMTFDTLKTQYQGTGSLTRVTYSRPIWLTEEKKES